MTWHVTDNVTIYSNLPSRTGRSRGLRTVHPKRENRLHDSPVHGARHPQSLLGTYQAVRAGPEGVRARRPGERRVPRGVRPPRALAAAGGAQEGGRRKPRQRGRLHIDGGRVLPPSRPLPWGGRGRARPRDGDGTLLAGPPRGQGQAQGSPGDAIVSVFPWRRKRGGRSVLGVQEAGVGRVRRLRERGGRGERRKKKRKEKK